MGAFHVMSKGAGLGERMEPLHDAPRRSPPITAPLATHSPGHERAPQHLSGRLERGRRTIAQCSSARSGRSVSSRATSTRSNSAACSNDECSLPGREGRPARFARCPGGGRVRRSDLDQRHDPPPESHLALAQAARRFDGPDVARGYRLDTNVVELDWLRFEGLLAAAGAAAEPAAAVGLFEEALALWQGEPFTDVEEWEPARALAARLEELRQASPGGPRGRVHCRWKVGERSRCARLVGHARTPPRASVVTAHARPVPVRPPGRCAPHLPAAPATRSPRSASIQVRTFATSNGR